MNPEKYEWATGVTPLEYIELLAEHYREMTLSSKNREIYRKVGEKWYRVDVMDLAAHLSYVDNLFEQFKTA